MAQSLEFKAARIESITTHFNGGGKANYDCELKVSAPLTKPMSELLGAEYLRSSGRERAVDFDFGLESIRFDLLPKEGMQQRLTADCYTASKFKAIRKKDKQKGRVTRVAFSLALRADPKTVLDYLLNVGGAEGVMTLEPLQGELFKVSDPVIPAARRAPPPKDAGPPAAGPRPVPHDGKAAAAGDDSGDPPEWVTEGKKPN